MSNAWTQLSETVRLCRELTRALGLIGWDQQTYLPKGGVEARADTRATLDRLAHETFTSPEIGDALSRLEEEVKGLPYESDEASIVRVTRREYDREVKLPSELVVNLAKATSLGQNAWEEAREKDDFKAFEPHLKRIVELQIEKARALGFEDDPYDALLDIFEPEMKTTDVAALFKGLKEHLVPLVQKISDSPAAVDDACLKKGYDTDAQWEFTLEVIKAIGFDMTHGRQDLSTHPFTIGIAPTDVRLTTRLDPHNLAGGLYASIHEAGHGMYEQGLPVELKDTLLCDSISLGIHESQSRLWENIVGRSRHFWHHFLPRLQEYFPGRLDDTDVEAMYRAVNKVHQPSKIRVDADEVTYNLHIFIRFELERALIHGDLAVKDLPAAWNEKTEEYLGFTPRNDQEGVLQDVHWSAGLFGYFPTYSLGTVLAAQLYEKLQEEERTLDEQISNGDFTRVKEWMRDRIHRHGTRFTPMELVQRATGRELETEPYIRYINQKYGEIYTL